MWVWKLRCLNGYYLEPFLPCQFGSHTMSGYVENDDGMESLMGSTNPLLSARKCNEIVYLDLLQCWFFSLSSDKQCKANAAWHRKSRTRYVHVCFLKLVEEKYRWSTGRERAWHELRTRVRERFSVSRAAWKSDRLQRCPLNDCRKQRETFGFFRLDEACS